MAFEHPLPTHQLRLLSYLRNQTIITITHGKLETLHYVIVRNIKIQIKIDSIKYDTLQTRYYILQFTQILCMTKLKQDRPSV